MTDPSGFPLQARVAIVCKENGKDNPVATLNYPEGFPEILKILRE
jgi:hypothetical protein